MGWNNGWTARVGFFAALERIVTRTTGLVPRADEASRADEARADEAPS